VIELDLDNLLSLVGKERKARYKRFYSTTGSFRAGNIPTNAKLSAKDVVAIRDLDKNGVTSKNIAKQFEVSYSHVRKIVNRKLWYDAEEQVSGSDESM
jgi:DNA invertase Pin-like site-specific DNA recombinase